MEQHSESVVIKELRSGSVTAFDTIYQKYSLRLFQFTIGFVKDEAESEEIVQEVFIKIWENRVNLKEGHSFKSYLFTIAYNAIRKYFNQKVKNEKLAQEWLGEQELSLDDPNRDEAFQSMTRQVEEVIATLPEKRREIFLLSKKMGYSNKEIAEELNISVKTVENQMTKALGFLKETLKEKGLSILLFFYLFF